MLKLPNIQREVNKGEENFLFLIFYINIISYFFKNVNKDFYSRLFNRITNGLDLFPISHTGRAGFEPAKLHKC